MSSRINIEPTIFINQRTDEKSYGVRVYDQYGQSYVNNWDVLPDNDMEVLILVKEESDAAIVDLMNAIIDNESGVMIGDKWYDWDEIKHIMVRG